MSIFTDDKKIVVVGAGLAGLTAAYRLHQAGADVHVYEARPRVGGRVFTAKIAGSIAELGAQNIADGGEAKNILRLVKEFELELVENKIYLDHQCFDGEKLISMQQLLKDCQFHPDSLKDRLNALAKRSKNMREVLSGLFDEEHPLYKIMSVRLAAYEGGSVEKLSPCYTETLYHMLMGGIASVHQKLGSEEPYINLLSVKEGNGMIAEKLAQALGDRLHLNKALASVLKEADDSYVLTFQDGQKVKADIVVLAIPCSVYAGIAFEANVIPLEKLAAIKNVQYGENAKIMVPYTHTLKVKGLSYNQMVGFLGMGQHILTLYYVSEASRFSVDTIAEIYNQDKPVIDMAFGNLGLSSMDPVFARDQSFAIYEGPVGFSWINDPYARGSYSYVAAGQEDVMTATSQEKGEIVKTMFAPINQRLYFAGEHASITETPGTMEAACESGERTARLIL